MKNIDISNFIEAHRRLEANKALTSPRIIKNREESFKQFVAKGLPTVKSEKYRYTNLRPIQNRNILDISNWGESEIDESQLDSLLSSEMTNIVIINGRFSAERGSALPQGVCCHNLYDFLVKDDSIKSTKLWEEFNECQNKFINNQNISLHDLNQSFAWSGLFLSVAEEACIEKPLQIIYFNSLSETGDSLHAPQTLVHIGPKAKVSLVETLYVGGNAKQTVVAQTNILVKRDANVSFAKHQWGFEESFLFSGVQIRAEERSQVETFILNRGTQINRLEIEVECFKESSLRAGGLYLANKNQQVDIYTSVYHREAHGNSQQFFKGLLDDEAHGVFNGKIYIDRDAQKVNSSLLNNNLMLSSSAEVDTKPELEVHADDVKAAHGATIGQLNDAEIFYLESRAIPSDLARQMLSAGFVKEVVFKIKNKIVQKHLLSQVESILKEFTHLQS